MTDFTTTFTVSQSPEAAYAAIVNPRAWWSGEHTGIADRLGDVFTYRYRDIHYSRQQVIDLVPNRRVAWRVTEGTLNFVADRNEWAGTTIIFDIEPGEGGRPGWPPEGHDGQSKMSKMSRRFFFLYL